MVIPYEQEETSLEYLNQNPEKPGANLSYVVSATCNNFYGPERHAYINITSKGNYDYEYSIVAFTIEYSKSGRVNATQYISNIHLASGNLMSYFINNISSSSTFTRYNSMVLHYESPNTTNSYSYSIIAEKGINCINGEQAEENLFEILNINNSKIEKDPSEYPGYFYNSRPSFAGFIESGINSILSCMFIKGGNSSFADEILGIKNKVICNFYMGLTKSNLKFKLVSLDYLFEYLSYIQAVWIAGIIFLALTVRQVRKKIRKGRLKS